MRTILQTTSQYALTLTGGAIAGSALGVSGRFVQAMEGIASTAPCMPAFLIRPVEFAMGLAIHEAVFYVSSRREKRRQMRERQPKQPLAETPPDPIPAPIVKVEAPVPEPELRSDPGPEPESQSQSQSTEPDPKTADSGDITLHVDLTGQDAPSPSEGAPEPEKAQKPKRSRSTANTLKNGARRTLTIFLCGATLVGKQWWRITKVIACILSADLIINSLSPLSGAAAALGWTLKSVADSAPGLGWLCGTDPTQPGRVLAAIFGSGLILLAYRIRNLIESNPNIVSQMSIHYRLVPFAHSDFWFSRFPLRRDYAVIKNQGFRFIADCCEITPTRKRAWFATICVPPPLLHQYQDVYYRSLRMTDSTGSMDITAEMSSDTQAETLLAGDGQTAENICLALDLDNLCGPNDAAKHQVQERIKGTLEKWYAVPINLLRNIGRLFTKKGKVKLMELGCLFKITGNFTDAHANSGDGRTSKIDLSLNEDYIYRALNLGAPCFDVTDVRSNKIATIVRAPTKRLASVFILRDYSIYIMDKNYDTDHFKAACAFFVDSIHNMRRLRKHLKWDTELKGISVDAYQRYAS